ncbi:hypothetical protein BJY00DRAFT_272868, partial [Aspergillus carlsbadensis]
MPLVLVTGQSAQAPQGGSSASPSSTSPDQGSDLHGQSRCQVDRRRSAVSKASKDQAQAMEYRWVWGHFRNQTKSDRSAISGHGVRPSNKDEFHAVWVYCIGYPQRTAFLV